MLAILNVCNILAVCTVFVFIFVLCIRFYICIIYLYFIFVYIFNKVVFKCICIYDFNTFNEVYCCV